MPRTSICPVTTSEIRRVRYSIICWILGGGSLAVDASYEVTLTLTDTVGAVSTYNITVPSAAYIMHVKKGGKAVGFGTAAGADNTVTFGWPVRLNRALEVSQGGTGANNAASACGNIGAVKKSGDTMTGNLYIQSSLYPSLYLQPTYNGTAFRTVFEGSVRPDRTLLSVA